MRLRFSLSIRFVMVTKWFLKSSICDYLPLPLTAFAGTIKKVLSETLFHTKLYLLLAKDSVFTISLDQSLGKDFKIGFLTDTKVLQKFFLMQTFPGFGQAF